MVGETRTGAGAGAMTDLGLGAAVWDNGGRSRDRGGEGGGHIIG